MTNKSNYTLLNFEESLEEEYEEYKNSIVDDDSNHEKSNYIKNNLFKMSTSTNIRI